MERIIKSKKATLRPKDLPHIAYLEELLAGAKPPTPKARRRPDGAAHSRVPNPTHRRGDD